MTDTVAADGAVVFLGLGTNLGDRGANLGAAVAAMATVVTVDACSDVYETAPVGILEQPRFYNMAVRGRTSLGPAELLHAVKQLERELGRVSTLRMGPRLIDIDVLLYGGLIVAEADLAIPHPRLAQRPFVLRPLLDLDPQLRHPVTGEPLVDQLARLRPTQDALVRLGSAAEILGIHDPPIGGTQ
jgi:2-amino-4-hydroxy-6-hydroxymethyldihydropteridine diphosphokinase